MSATTEAAQGLLDRTRQAAHPLCAVCGRAGDCGLGLHFRLCPDGAVEAEFNCPERFQGYRGILHGGVTSSLLDGAMTNCLFARGVVAVTAEMTVRFRHPIRLDQPLVVRARVVDRLPPLYRVEAQALQAGQLMAKAAGKFMDCPRVPFADDNRRDSPRPDDKAAGVD